LRTLEITVPKVNTSLSKYFVEELYKPFMDMIGVLYPNEIYKNTIRSMNFDKSNKNRYTRKLYQYHKEFSDLLESSIKESKYEKTEHDIK